MEPPERTDFRYFAYGPFKPGEPAFYRIKDSIVRTEEFRSPGFMCVWDGFPKFEFNPNSESSVEGCFFTFENDLSKKAYQSITEYYDDKNNNYRWMEVTMASGDRFNAIVRSKPKNPKYDYFNRYDGDESWTAKDDPLFSKALEAVSMDIKQIRDFRFSDDKGQKFEWTEYYELQMKYLLLWSIFERFISLKIGFQEENGPNRRSKFVKEYPPFEKLCSLFIKEKMTIYKFTTPNSFNQLDPDEGNLSIEFFHQLRTNIIHRGKSAQKEGELLRKSFIMLCGIVKEMLKEEGLFSG